MIGLKSYLQVVRNFLMIKASFPEDKMTELDKRNVFYKTKQRRNKKWMIFFQS